MHLVLVHLGETLFSVLWNGIVYAPGIKLNNKHPYIEEYLVYLRYRYYVLLQKEIEFSHIWLVLRTLFYMYYFVDFLKMLLIELRHLIIDGAIYDF